MHNESDRKHFRGDMDESVRVLYLGGGQDDAVFALQHLELAGYQAHLEHPQTPEALAAALQAGSWHLAIADPAACNDDLPGLVERLAAAEPPIGLILVGQHLDRAGCSSRQSARAYRMC